MTDRPPLDDLLGDLEATIAKLADGTAPLEELVEAHALAVRLLGQAQARFAELKARAEQTATLLAD